MSDTLVNTGAQAGDCGASSQIESAAREMFQIAALLLGNETDALDAVEQSIASIEVDPCSDAATASALHHRALVDHAVSRVAALHPEAMEPATAADLGGCVETDELSAAGVTRSQLDELLTGSDRQRMRQWLESLQPVERVVFVLRAMLGETGEEAAGVLARATGKRWNAGHVGGAYRSALCSLASALVHAAAH
jgi:DNA-directed RNA polymerase specialized sigma24 family protein